MVIPKTPLTIAPGRRRVIGGQRKDHTVRESLDFFAMGCGSSVDLVKDLERDTPAFCLLAYQGTVPCVQHATDTIASYVLKLSRNFIPAREADIGLPPNDLVRGGN